MKLSEFDFNLPPGLIAQEPMKPRDHSRLLILDKESGKIEHKQFFDIQDFLKEGDLIVFNNSKVFPARLIGKRRETGGKLEVFLLRELSGKGVWSCLVGGRRVKTGLAVEFDKGLVAELIENNSDGTWKVQFNLCGKDLMDVVQKIGKVPLPPYIKREADKGKLVAKNDKISYQTVYADENKIGSVAAPTAGFHFTPELLDKLKTKGVQLEYVTLHVGMGTFAPVKVNDITKHKMHAEWVEINKDTVKRLRRAKENGKRIITVGTTSTRTLEALSDVILEGVKRPIGSRRDSITPVSRSRMTAYSTWVNIFIYPGYKFKLVDAMITNFHLPKSTLLMLVSALAGSNNIKKAYQEAIKKNYRFYSYGDAMLIN